jgi:alkylation response protein AidB-like acyl-CoA dehydrogenase
VDFELNDEQRMLRDVTRTTLRDHCPPEKIRARIDAPDQAALAQPDPKLWSLGAELGWTGLTVPEEYGGTGQGLTELALVAEELGRAAAPDPFVPSALVGLAVGRGGDAALRRQVLPGLADGTLRATLALSESRRPWSPTGVAGTRAVRDGDAIVLTGVKTAVPDAAGADLLLVTAELAGTPVAVLVDGDAPGLSIRRQRLVDVTRDRHQLTLDGVRVPSGRLLDLDAQWLLDAGAVLTAADALGAAERLLAMTVEHAKARFQFGRAIGSFQAVKHKVADMRLAVGGIRAAVCYAAVAADTGLPDAGRAASVAKAFAAEQSARLAGEALQTHGGIGFTWEHDLHLYLRRIKADEILFGDAAWHHERVCALLLLREGAY